MYAPKWVRVPVMDGDAFIVKASAVGAPQKLLKSLPKHFYQIFFKNESI